MGDVSALLNLGGLAVVAYLLLTRLEVRMSALERAVNRLVVVQALEIATRETSSERVKQQARELIQQVRRDTKKDLGEPSIFTEGA